MRVDARNGFAQGALADASPRLRVMALGTIRAIGPLQDGLVHARRRWSTAHDPSG